MSNNKMNTKIILSVLISLFTVFLGSNLLSNEMFIDFQVAYPITGDTDFKVYNTGIIQAKNVNVHIFFDSPYNSVEKSDCIEGQIIQSSSEKNSIHLKFLRMSPGIKCVFDVTDYANNNIMSATILSDNRSVKIYPESFDIGVYIWNSYTILLFFILAQIFFIFSGFVTIRNATLLYVYSRNHKKIDCWKKIQKKIKCTYNLRINAYDVSVLCCIVCDGIYTISRISAHTKISKTYVRKRVVHMQENDIILEEKKIAVPSDLEDYIRQICNRTQENL